MRTSLTIPCDLPCEECGYNLRMQPLEGRCPECGQSVFKTLCAAPKGPASELRDLLITHRRRRMETIALAANCGVDAVLLVLDAFRYAQAISGKGSAPSQEHIAPRALCSGFRRFVRHYFNDNEEGKELLSEWGIRQSEDLGRIVFAMVEAGWMKASLDDAISQFAGLFTLDTLFPNPG